MPAGSHFILRTGCQDADAASGLRFAWGVVEVSGRHRPDAGRDTDEDDRHGSGEAEVKAGTFTFPGTQLVATFSCPLSVAQ